MNPLKGEILGARRLITGLVDIEPKHNGTAYSKLI
jgi:hypothetical protein